MRKVFAGHRKELVAALLAAVGGAGALTACGSDSATYRPAPRYTNTAPATTYSQPGPTNSGPPATYQAPPPSTTPPPRPTGGQAGCGKKCG